MPRSAFNLTTITVLCLFTLTACGRVARTPRTAQPADAAVGVLFVEDADAGVATPWAPLDFGSTDLRLGCAPCTCCCLRLGDGGDNPTRPVDDAGHVPVTACAACLAHVADGGLGHGDAGVNLALIAWCRVETPIQ